MTAVFLLGCESKKDKEKARAREILNEYIKSYVPRIVDGNQEPPYPDPDENNKTLLGIDSDNDGIRDDLEAVINDFGKNKNERNLLRKIYRLYSERFRNTNPTKEEHLKNLDKFDTLFSCSLLVYESGVSEFNKHFRLLSKMVLDTPLRLSADNNFTMKFPYSNEGLTDTEIYFLGQCICGFKIEDQVSVFDRYRSNTFGTSEINFMLPEILDNNARGKYERHFPKKNINSCISHLKQ